MHPTGETHARSQMFNTFASDVGGHGLLCLLNQKMLNRRNDFSYRRVPQGQAGFWATVAFQQVFLITGFSCVCVI